MKLLGFVGFRATFKPSFIAAHKHLGDGWNATLDVTRVYWGAYPVADKRKRTRFKRRILQNLTHRPEAAGAPEEPRPPRQINPAQVGLGLGDRDIIYNLGIFSPKCARCLLIASIWRVVGWGFELSGQVGA